MAEPNPDLESFRQQWKAEVTQKKTQSNQAATRATQQPSTAATRRRPSIIPSTARRRLLTFEADGPRHDDPLASEDEDKAAHESNKRRTGPLADWVDEDMLDERIRNGFAAEREPESALEHYEKAVERETQGQLGESLDLYRKAFKMDDRVDVKYKNKHFPPSAPKPPPPTKSANTNPSNAAATVPNTAHHSSSAEEPTPAPLPIKELMQSFATLPISRAEPPMEGEPQPPCPIAQIPEEILLHILTDLALSDFQSFVKTAQVCKRLAYLIATEDTIWKRICVGPELGYGGMVYEWKCNVDGSPLELDVAEELSALSLATPPRTLTPPNAPHTSSATSQAMPSASTIPGTTTTTTTTIATTTEAEAVTITIAVPSLLPPPLPTPALIPPYTTYKQMWRLRPRIRFNGIYISTCNYIRAGAVAPSRTWGAAVHVVTYYRYLRFFRDGRCLSLCTTHEPGEIVRQLTPDLLDKLMARKVTVPAGRQRKNRQVLSEVRENPLDNTYKGRWKLGGEPVAEGKERYDESALSVETEGVYEKYTYRMDFDLKGQEKGRPRLLWTGFNAFNKETDSWAELSRKNEKGFVFSRVKAYGSLG